MIHWIRSTKASTIWKAIEMCWTRNLTADKLNIYNIMNCNTKEVCTPKLEPTQLNFKRARQLLVLYSLFWNYEIIFNTDRLFPLFPCLCPHTSFSPCIKPTQFEVAELGFSVFVWTSSLGRRRRRRRKKNAESYRIEVVQSQRASLPT